MDLSKYLNICSTGLLGKKGFRLHKQCLILVRINEKTLTFAEISAILKVSTLLTHFQDKKEGVFWKLLSGWFYGIDINH